MSLFNKKTDKTMTKTPQVLPEYYLSERARPQVQQFNLGRAYQVAANSWVLQEIYRAIIQEIKRVGLQIEPRFKVRCATCGTEYNTLDHAKCLTCGRKRMKEPDYTQRQRLVHLLRRPNSKRETMDDIIRSLIYHDLVADDWYLAIEYAEAPHVDGEVEFQIPPLIPAEIVVIDSRYISPVVDRFGNFTSGKWFCPIHWEPIALLQMEKQFDKAPGPCDKCGRPMIRVAYVQTVNGLVTAAWGRNQMINGSTNKVSPKILGEPRLKALWNVVLTMQFMDNWFHDTYRQGRISKILNFPGYDQTEVTKISRAIKAENNRQQIADERLQNRRRVERKQRLMMLGSDANLQVLDVDINPKDMALLDYYKLGIQAVAGVYGVQAIFYAYVESGKAGTTPAMQIEVMNRTTEGIQNEFLTRFNDYVLPIFGITDWVIKFGDLEKKDARRDAEVEHTLANAAATWVSAGFDVWLNEDQDKIIKSTKRILPEEPVSPTGERRQNQKESDASGREVEGTSTQRKPHGTREANTQDEQRAKK